MKEVMTHGGFETRRKKGSEKTEKQEEVGSRAE
jgi:hypothetical protein